MSSKSPVWTESRERYCRFLLLNQDWKDFERLVAKLLEAEEHKDIQHWGAAGKDGGVDCRSRGPDGALWVTQCKRYASFGPARALAALAEVAEAPPTPAPEVFHLAVSCPLSKVTRLTLEEEVQKLGLGWSVVCWGSEELVRMIGRTPSLWPLFEPPAGASGFWNVPPRSRHFTGREDVLEALAEQLEDGGTVAVTQAITGLGGVGKTQAAIEYCHRYGDRYRDLFWAVAPDAEALGAEYAHLAVELDLVGKGTAQADAAAAFLRYLSTRTDWLMVVDNVESEEAWERPRSPGGHVLVTSRLKRPFHLAGKGTLALDVLEEGEAVELLFERSGRVELSEVEREAARDLAVELLGGLPLAIEQAGAYLAEHELRISAYRDRFRLELLEKGQARDRSREDTVAVTWKLNFEAVAKESATAARALEICSLLSPEDIPLELFVEASEALGLEPLEDPEVLQERLVSPLLRYSLTKFRDPGEGLGKLSVHRLVQRVVRRSLGGEGLATTWRSTHEAFEGLFPEPSGSPEIWPRCELLEGQIFAQLESWSEAEGFLPTYDPTGLWLWAAQYLGERGSYRRAKRIENQALEICRRVLGEEHPDTLMSRNNLAETLRTLGDAAGARDLHAQTLEVYRRVLGEEHPGTLMSRNNLALTLGALGDAAGARDLHAQTLEVNRRVLGEEHPNTLSSRNNLAAALWALGDAAGARGLHVQVLEVRIRVLGEEHPDTLMSRNNLAETLRTLGDAAGARGLHAQTLEIYRRVLGEEHPNTLSSRNNLATTLRDLGDAAGAQKLFEEAHEGFLRVLGEEHPSTQTVARNLADLSASE